VSFLDFNDLVCSTEITEARWIINRKDPGFDLRISRLPMVLGLLAWLNYRLKSIVGLTVHCPVSLALVIFEQ
jgi:hypothetical protein